ncbi:hypothetical protein ARMGADRAFT_1039737 [Armillaria gallica]|uniref:Uncharacterized protein n=1 Tax=Armillaria gallica TaxID=47427 RepID=A0A2H3CXK3_ARMGA|nr:hypothetical protein ARMGADRAFT_1039737 [Armillaria gallica]
MASLEAPQTPTRQVPMGFQEYFSWRTAHASWITGRDVPSMPLAGDKPRQGLGEGYDPSLIDGAAFIVQQKDFHAHIAKYGKQIPFDPSDCQDHEAVKLATTKRSARLATSGVGTTSVHGLHLLWSSSAFDSVLWERIDIYPTSMKPQQAPMDFIYLIPKFHLPAHIPSCHTKYSFYKTPYVGKTDGEAPECGWSQLNPLTTSLKVMGPGGYLDTLDDHIRDYNYRKTTLISSTLLRAVREAIPSRTLHAAIYAEFTAKLTTNKEEAVEMAKMAAAELVEQSESTQTSPQKSVQDPEAVIFAIQHETGSSAMILQGVELENDQRRLKLAYTALGMHSTDHEWARVQEGLNQMHWHLDAWFEIQQLYMPGVLAAKVVAAEQAAAEAAIEASNVDEPPRNMRKGQKPRKCRAQAKPIKEALEAVDVPLFLPSNTVSHILTNRKLADFKFRLREAEAYECLTTLRWLLIYRSHIYKFKDIHITDAEETAEALRIEWCKTRARVHRWREEAILVLEEMKRVKAFFAWEGQTWLVQAA